MLRGNYSNVEKIILYQVPEYTQRTRPQQQSQHFLRVTPRGGGAAAAQDRILAAYGADSLIEGVRIVGKKVGGEERAKASRRWGGGWGNSDAPAGIFRCAAEGRFLCRVRLHSIHSNGKTPCTLQMMQIAPWRALECGGKGDRAECIQKMGQPEFIERCWHSLWS